MIGLRATRLVLCVALLAACGAEDEIGPPAVGGSAGSGGEGGGEPSPCEPGTRLLDDGTCQIAGVQDDGCAAGTWSDENGDCEPAGVPTDGCCDGFEHDGNGGCVPVLPATPCGAGQMAVPGESACRDVAPCADGAWGDIPVEASTVYVDGSHNGAQEGTAANPYQVIQDGIDAAPAGAIVAVAEGSYAEDLVLSGKAVRLWGRCPGLVEIVGSSGAEAAVVIDGGADGAELRDLAIRADGAGVMLTDADAVVLERVWIHDTAGRGVDASLGGGPTSLTVRGALVESTRERGIYVAGIEAIIASTVVRDTSTLDGAESGRGINVRDDPSSHTLADATIRGSVVERSVEAAVLIHASHGDIECSVIRDTAATPTLRFGRGLIVQADPLTDQPASGSLTGLVVEHNLDAAVFVAGSTVSVAVTTIRDTAANLDESSRGYGIVAQNMVTGGPDSELTVLASLVETSHEVGILVAGAPATVRSTVVRDTEPVNGFQGTFGGRGINVEEDDQGRLSTATIEGCVVEANHDAGIFAEAAELYVTGSVVRNTTPARWSHGTGLTAQDGAVNQVGSAVTVEASVFEANTELGLHFIGSDATLRGVLVQDTMELPLNTGLGIGVAVDQAHITSQPAALVLQGSVVQRNQTAGVFTLSGHATLEDTVVLDSLPSGDDELFGDGVALMSAFDLGFDQARVTMRRCRIDGSARAGVVNFAGALEVASTVLECNALDLDGEQFQGGDFLFTDLGGNRCGCAADLRECQVATALLEPPQPPEQ